MSTNNNLPVEPIKIFGENAGENIGQFGSALAGSPNRTGDIEQIQALAAWQNGWTGGVVSVRNYPALEEMTGIQKVLSYQLAYLKQKGIPEWDSTVTYFANTGFCQVNGTVYQSLTNNNIGNNPTEDAEGTNWQKIEFGGGGGLPIGTVFPAMAAADYVPVGALGCDGTQYSGTQFPALWSDYLTAQTPKLLTKNYTQHQADITEYGKCAAFGVEHTTTATHTGTGITDVEVTAATWETKVSAVGSYVFSFDGANWSLDSTTVELADYGVVLTGTPASGDTVTVSYSYGANFKVPYIADGTSIQQALSDNEIGKAYNAGLPNITGWVNTAAQLGGAVGAFSVESADQYFSGQAQNGSDALRFDASASSSIYGNSDTVQPEAVSLRWFVVVANAVENEAAMDWSEWASGLAGKANVDANNFSAAGKAGISSLLTPAYEHLIGSIFGPNSTVVPAWNTNSLKGSYLSYTAPANGWITAGAEYLNKPNFLMLAIGREIMLEGKKNPHQNYFSGANNSGYLNFSATIRAKKGETYTFCVINNNTDNPPVDSNVKMYASFFIPDEGEIQ